MVCPTLKFTVRLTSYECTNRLLFIRTRPKRTTRALFISSAKSSPPADLTAPESHSRIAVISGETGHQNSILSGPTQKRDLGYGMRSRPKISGACWNLRESGLRQTACQSSHIMMIVVRSLRESTCWVRTNYGYYSCSMRVSCGLAVLFK